MPKTAAARDLLDRLWRDYAAMNPQAGRIHQLLSDRGETVVNDHIALRTFDDPRVNIDVLSRAFINGGYTPGERYEFSAKKLRARHFEPPPEAGDGLPLVFISDLKLAECSDTVRRIVGELIGQVDKKTWSRPDLPVIGRPWSPTVADYEALAGESEYAAWLSAFGFRANHFTVLVNALASFDSIKALNDYLQEQGFELNAGGGLIKGMPEQLLEQSSTLADMVEVEFADGRRTIPGCYYEFARRYPDATGKLFTGFIAASASKIFESTDRR